MLSVDNFPEDLAFHGKGAELSQVVSRGIARYIGKAVRVGQVRVGQAYFFAKTIHLSQKYSD